MGMRASGWTGLCSLGEDWRGWRKHCSHSPQAARLPLERLPVGSWQEPLGAVLVRWISGPWEEDAGAVTGCPAPDAAGVPLAGWLGPVTHIGLLHGGWTSGPSGPVELTDSL